MAGWALVPAGIAAAPFLIAAAGYAGWGYPKGRQRVNQSIKELNTAISELRDRRPALTVVTATAERNAHQPTQELPSQTQIAELIATLEQ